MDEKPENIIDDNDKPLENNGFSSSSNHQIDDFDDSSEQDLQNNQSNQSILRNTNPMSKNNVPKALTGSPKLNKNQIMPNSSQGTNTQNDINESPKSRLFSNPLNALYGERPKKEVDLSGTFKGFLKRLSLPLKIKIAIGIIIVVLLIFPIINISKIYVANDLPLDTDSSDVAGNGSNSAVLRDYLSYKGLQNEKPQIQSFYNKVDVVTQTYPAIDRTLYLGGMFYATNKIDDYLDKLNGTADPDEFDFTIMESEALSYANQMIYSTVIFDNNIIRREKEKVEIYYEEENGKKVKKKRKVKYYEYECPSSTHTIRSNLKEFCENNVAVYNDGPGEIDYTTADACLDLVDESNVSMYKKEDSNFPDDMKCVSINYETNTEISKQKYENFLTYVLIPSIYVDKEKYPIEGGYDWEEMVSVFQTKATSLDKNIYNIPAYKVGDGKEIDYYAGLSTKERNDVDEAVRTIMDYVSASKQKSKIDGNYHIQGNASLPLDFVIRDPIEDTINKRVTSPFGKRIDPISGKDSFHRGVDFSWVTTDDPVYAMLDGKVYWALTSADCGIEVMLEHDINNDGVIDYYTRYCHLKSKFVSKGDVVTNGQQIGIMGNTGNSRGRHLHFEIRESDFYTRTDPVPYLIDILKNKSTLTSKVNDVSGEKNEELKTKYESLISGKVKTRNGVVTTAKFLVDNLSSLPYFCGGYTPNLIDENWFSDQIVTDSSCSNNGTTSKYGLDNTGFVSWVLTQSGYGNKDFSYQELLKLGKTIDIFDDSIQLGDIAYRGQKMGIIIELSDEKATIAYMDENGLKAQTIDRKNASPLFNKAISMNSFYTKSINSLE